MIADITVYLYNLTYDPRLEDENSALFIRHAHAFCKDVSVNIHLCTYIIHKSTSLILKLHAYFKIFQTLFHHRRFSLIYDSVILFNIQIEKIYMSSALKHSFIDCKMFDYM